MQFSETIKINARPDQIFPFYANVSSWSTWDPDVKSASGSFRTGASGKLKPTKGPEATIFFTEISENKSFTTTSKLPLCTMSIEHTLIADHAATEVTHNVVFSGLLSPIFGRLIGSGIKKGLPETLRGLKRMVESTI